MEFLTEYRMQAPGAASPRTLWSFSVLVHLVPGFVSGFLPTPHYCDAAALGYLIPPGQKHIEEFHPDYMSCQMYLQ